MVWKPHVTVAAVIERDGNFLLVEEHTEHGVRLNQPAGHLEPGETIIDAVVRETLEETAYVFRPEHLVGVYHWQHPSSGACYLRFAFCGSVDSIPQDRALDKEIIRALWIDGAEVSAQASRHRSPLVRCCIEDFVRGQRFPLDLLVHVN